MEKIANILKGARPGKAEFFVPPPPEPRLTFRRVVLQDLDTTWHPRVKVAVEAAKSWNQRREQGFLARVTDTATCGVSRLRQQGKLHQTSEAMMPQL